MSIFAEWEEGAAQWQEHKAQMEREAEKRKIRAQVVATIADTMRDARDQGLDHFAATKKAYPGTPDSVLYTAEAELEYEDDEAWWSQVERTIDAQVIKNALTVPKGGAD